MAATSSAPPNRSSAAPDRAPIGFVEFVGLVAALMSLTAMGIDSMLPALPAIGDALHVANPNSRQYVIGTFVLGFGIAQLAHGPLADRFGRRRVLIVALLAYAVANVLCAVSRDFTLLLASRFAGGAAIAASRVATVAIVRDCFHGRAMARVMSIAFMVFMIVPIVAPAFGAAVLLVGDWRAIFWAIAGATLAVLIWFWFRMPETLNPADRHPIEARRIAAGWRLAVTNRWSLGYTIAATMLTGALYGYLNSIEQIMADVFHRPRLLIVIFATCATTMAAANLLNARLVMRVGTRRLSHGAVIVLILASLVHLLVALAGLESIVTFAVLMAITLGAFGLSTSNFSSMAMEDMGHIAGTASSVQGFAAATGGSALGALIGQSFDGSTAPLAAGFLVCGAVALAVVAVTEGGRLFGTR